MSRSMKLGIATVVAAFVVSLMATEDAEARHRRRGRHRHGGCCGYVAPSCCGAPVCGVATNCPGGVCGVAGGAYSGGHTTGYGTAPGALNGQGTVNQSPTPATNGAGTFRQEQGSSAAGQNGATRSPSDRPPAPAGAANGSAGQPGGEGSTSAPPPPPQEQ
ncbi:MAG: hypothetical protein WD894_10420 [Pirellulales bacterium]